MPAIAPDALSPSAVQAARDLRVGVSRLRRRLREVTHRDELTPSQTSVLSRLMLGGAASASDLAAAERVRPQSMAATLVPLQERALVRRDPDPHDGRRQLISLTEAGLAYIADSRREREEWLARTLQDRFSEAERAVVIEALALLERVSAP